MRLPLKGLAKVACVVRVVVNPTQAVVVAVSCVVMVTASVLPVPCFLIEAGQSSTKKPPAVLLSSVMVSSVKGLVAVTFTAKSVPMRLFSLTVVPLIVAVPLQSATQFRVGFPQPALILNLALSTVPTAPFPIIKSHTSTLFTGWLNL